MNILKKYILLFLLTLCFTSCDFWNLRKFSKQMAKAEKYMEVRRDERGDYVYYKEPVLSEENVESLVKKKATSRTVLEDGRIQHVYYCQRKFHRNGPEDDVKIIANYTKEGLLQENFMPQRLSKSVNDSTFKKTMYAILLGDLSPFSKKLHGEYQKVSGDNYKIYSYGQILNDFGTPDEPYTKENPRLVYTYILDTKSDVPNEKSKTMKVSFTFDETQKVKQGRFDFGSMRMLFDYKHE